MQLFAGASLKYTQAYAVEYDEDIYSQMQIAAYFSDPGIQFVLRPEDGGPVNYRFANQPLVGTYHSAGVPVPGASVLTVFTGSTAAYLAFTGSTYPASFSAWYKSTGEYVQWPGSTAISPIVITGLNPATEYTFKVIATNPSGTADSNEVVKTTKYLNPYLTRIELAATDLLASMAKAGGFWYDWGSSTQRDFAKATFVKGSAISWVDLIPIEDNLDGPNSAEVNLYQNRVKMVVTTAAKMAVDNDNPKEAYKVEIAKMIEDLKKVFGNNLAVSAQAISFYNEIISIMYTGAPEIKWDDAAGDAFTPGKLITKWDITYAQKRAEPNQRGL
jgi:hypothetical protein